MKRQGIDRSEAARRGWLTRRANEAARAAEHARRSEAARRGWETRRANAERIERETETEGRTGSPGDRSDGGDVGAAGGGYVGGGSDFGGGGGGGAVSAHNITYDDDDFGFIDDGEYWEGVEESIDY